MLWLLVWYYSNSTSTITIVANNATSNPASTNTQRHSLNRRTSTMSSFVEKIANPAQTLTGFKNSAASYYKPLVRAGSVKPLWHLMIFTSAVMYTTNFLCLKGAKVKHAREEQATALKEYYEKHGITPHH